MMAHAAAATAYEHPPLPPIGEPLDDLEGIFESAPPRGGISNHAASQRSASFAATAAKDVASAAAPTNADAPTWSSPTWPRPASEAAAAGKFNATTTSSGTPRAMRSSAAAATDLTERSLDLEQIIAGCLIALIALAIIEALENRRKPHV